MERVQSMFSNAYNTPAGHLVEKATAVHLVTEDWGLNMELCDTINSYSDGPKDAVKAIKRRLASNKNYNQICLTLSVIESCIKNCGSKFVVLVTTREFAKETLLKILQPKNSPSTVLQEKVLGLIKQLAETFGSNPQMCGVAQVYQEMKNDGVEFPQTTALNTSMTEGPHPTRTRSKNRHHEETRHTNQPVNPTKEQITKLRKDMSIVVGNLKVFSEMLTELNPSSCDAPDVQLMQELNRTCRAMQKRVVELLEQIAHEEITVDLLKINDDLNNIFLRYDRFERYRTSSKSPANKPQKSVSASAYPPSDQCYPPPQSSLSVPVEEPPPSYSDTEQPTPEVSDLIDFSADNGNTTATAAQPPTVLQDLAGLNLDSTPSANTDSSTKPGVSMSNQLDAYAGSDMAEIGGSVDEIEQWLATNGSNPDQQPTQSAGDGISDEFNTFLGSRANAQSATNPTSSAYPPLS